MAQATAPPSTSEKTFTSYTKEQGEAYAKGRPDYSPKFYQSIIDDHAATGGQFDRIVDLGCGPGNVARALSPHFAHAFGLDPSEGMIAVARSKGGLTATSEPIRYEISTAEDLGRSLSPPIQAGSIDLITAGNAAHWFKMQEFWHQAARVLKPHGSVVLWTSNPAKMHPSVPNAAAIDQALNDLGEGALKPYMAEGNVLTRDGYSSLPLPWTIDPPQPDFDEKDFVRKDWTLPEDDPNHTQVDLDKLEQIMDTMSPVTRWREAHPELRGTDQDVVKIHRNKIARLLHEAGVEPGKEVLTSIPNLAVLIVKKRGN
ncbi:hypothetical protein N7468_003522 [Penicillium chermesinum]|uniref:Methyltransferase type 11 domain-containing protein n=1 Tax=Penicillium chermesinum TaxID=63820 RepID=A0A9W9P982_9EURO|nr:uncharacterized protein N7468_003522 [Penicillium chermesinum]KAJ5238903.1 hypothetical protein N7468_003522 [Penicillium chermesinum]